MSAVVVPVVAILCLTVLALASWGVHQLLRAIAAGARAYRARRRPPMAPSTAALIVYAALASTASVIVGALAAAATGHSPLVLVGTATALTVPAAIWYARPVAWLEPRITRRRK